MDEKQLLTLIKQGDQNAFKTIYDLYWDRVYYFCTLYLNNISSVEEVVQEVFVKLWEIRTFIKENESFKGLLFIITRNIIFNHSRKKVNENFYKMTVIDSFQETDSIEDELEVKDLKMYIDKLVSELPPRQQEVFILSREKYLSYKEIAFKLRITEKTVERHINEALKTLRKHIPFFSIFLYDFLKVFCDTML